jgi:hypothetical protein
MKHLLFSKDMINGPCKLMSKDGEGFCLAMFPIEFCPILHSLGVSPEEKHGSLGECPFQMDVTDLLSR